MVPKSLKTWFTIHFIADYIFAIPLLIAPVTSLKLLGWETIDPVATRIAAAALFGIGGISLLARNEDPLIFKTMLNLKLIWSSSAVIGILWSIIQGAPEAAWLFLVIFVLFFF